MCRCKPKKAELTICKILAVIPKSLPTMAPIFLIAGFYLCTGVTVLIWARDGLSLEPWCMGLPFAVGQFLAAAILYWTLERRT